MRHGGIALAVYGGLIVLTWFGFQAVPGASSRRWTSSTWSRRATAAGASLDRTEAVTRHIAEIGLKQPGVAHAVEFAACRSMDSPELERRPHFFPLEDFPQRNSRALSGRAIARL